MAALWRLISFSRTIRPQTPKSRIDVFSLLHHRQLSAGQFENLVVEKKGEKKNVAVVKMNRPKTMNALCDALMSDMSVALEQLEQDEDVACIIITGSQRAFAVGADVPEMSQKTFHSVVEQDFPANFCSISNCKKPTIAAVNGYALGGGCEVAMMCDIVYAGDKAQFSQPEITLSTIPGAGGTQRLIRTVGKYKAMEMVLTGNRVSAEEAERMGMISKVFPAADLVDEAIKTAEKIAGFSRLTVALCKEAVNASQELSLSQGLHLEKRYFHLTFGTNDRREGMTAFVEKKKPEFTDS